MAQEREQRQPEMVERGVGVGRDSRRSNVTFSRILCAPPFAAAVRCVFSQKWHSRRRGVAKIFSLRHLKHGSHFFEPECAAQPCQSHFCMNFDSVGRQLEVLSIFIFCDTLSERVPLLDENAPHCSHSVGFWFLLLRNRASRCSLGRLRPKVGFSHLGC